MLSSGGYDNDRSRLQDVELFLFLSLLLTAVGIAWFPVETRPFSAVLIAGVVLALSTWKNPYPHGDLGVIKKGAYADILLIDGDPTQDIRLLMDSDNIDFPALLKSIQELFGSECVPLNGQRSAS